MNDQKHRCPALHCTVMIPIMQLACTPHTKLASESARGSALGAMRQVKNARTDEQRVEAIRLASWERSKAVKEINDRLKLEASL